MPPEAISTRLQPRKVPAPGFQESVAVPVYGAALLHDIGRWMQYESAIPHEKASAMLASDILDECGFSEEEKGCILAAISDHRDRSVEKQKTLSGLIYRADKMSRPCFACAVRHLCDWKQDKKNEKLIW